MGGFVARDKVADMTYSLQLESEWGGTYNELIQCMQPWTHDRHACCCRLVHMRHRTEHPPHVSRVCKHFFAAFSFLGSHLMSIIGWTEFCRTYTRARACTLRLEIRVDLWSNKKVLPSLCEQWACPLPPPFPVHALSAFLDMCLTLRLAGVVGLPPSLYCCPAATASTGRPAKRLR